MPDIQVLTPASPRRSGAALFAALLGAVLGLSAPPASAQTKVVLKDMPAVRGLEGQSRGGLTGSPIAPVAGKLGQSSALVDLDGDGFDDLVVGAPTQPVIPSAGVLDDAGHAYILFGSAGSGTPGSSGDFSFYNFAAGTAINLAGDPGDLAGSAIAAAGDVNGDGRQDVLIGTPGRTLAGRTSAGGCYLLFGRADWKTLPKGVTLASLTTGASPRALYIEGARAFGTAGAAVSGGVDCNSDGRDDVIIGAPLDSTGTLSQNGTATVLYGQAGFPALHTLDLLTQGSGQVTVVSGTADFQFMGFSVAGIGRFDPVLPMTNNVTSPLLGDDVAIGAPGTSAGAKFFAGAIYVLRGIASGTPGASYTAADFGNGPNKAGIVYTGKAAGDQAGFWVAPAGDIIYDGQQYDDFIATAPFSDGIGKPNSGSIYVLGGYFNGFLPQGFDLGLLGHGDPGIIGIHIQGAASSDGSEGVYATTSGDWNGDGLTDLIVGFPHATHVSGPGVFVGAGRASVLNGAVVLFSLGTVDLSMPAAGTTLLSFEGEGSAASAGTGLAHGDFNGDGLQDVAVGAIGAPSDPVPGDPTGIGNAKTGRAHLVYGPVLREQSLLPAASHFGGPPVTLTALNVPTGLLGVKVDGLSANILSVVAGDTGTVTFEAPAPAVIGSLSDVEVQCTAGKLTLANVLQYTPLAVTTGPSPPTSFAGATVTFTGQAFSSVGDMSVSFGGVSGTVTAVDGLAGTMSVVLPAGLPSDVPVDVVVDDSNGHVVLADAMTFVPISVTGINPAQGPQTSGVYFASATPYAGQPSVTADVTLATSGGPLPGSLTIQFGSDALGWHTAPVVATNGLVVTVNVPDHLLGPQDTKVSVRATGDGHTAVLTDAFTYLASDFKSLDQDAQAGYGAVPPVVLAAGQAQNGSQLLLLLDRIPPQNQLAILFVGLGLVDPPLNLKGGHLPINLALPFFVFYLPFPGAPTLPLSQQLPASFDPSADGAKVYVSFITREFQGGHVLYGFANTLEITVHAVP